MGYFAVVPNPVLDSKIISDSEKLLYGRISLNLNERGFCDKSDEFFAKKSDVDERTIRRRLKNLEEHGFITRIYDRKTIVRRIYLKEYIPQFMDEKLPEKSFADIVMFKTAFPERLIDATTIPGYVDMELLIKKIKEFKWLVEAKNMSLSSCVNRYYQIINDAYKEITSEKLIKQKVVINGKMVVLELTESELKELNQIKSEIGFIPQEILAKYMKND